MKDFKQWDGFAGRLWKEGVDVRDFIQNNYTPYDGDDSFLEGPTEATNRLWGKVSELQKEERAKGGVLDMETDVVTGITAYGAAYIDDSMKDMEQVVGLQTDKPLKRHLCHTAESRWLRNPVKCMDINQIHSFMRSLPNTIKHITRVYLISIHRKC